MEAQRGFTAQANKKPKTETDGANVLGNKTSDILRSVRGILCKEHDELPISSVLALRVRELSCISIVCIFACAPKACIVTPWAPLWLNYESNQNA